MKLKVIVCGLLLALWSTMSQAECLGFKMSVAGSKNKSLIGTFIEKDQNFSVVKKDKSENPQMREIPYLMDLLELNFQPCELQENVILNPQWQNNLRELILNNSEVLYDRTVSKDESTLKLENTFKIKDKELDLVCTSPLPIKDTDTAESVYRIVTLYPVSLVHSGGSTYSVTYQRPVTLKIEGLEQPIEAMEKWSIDFEARDATEDGEPTLKFKGKATVKVAVKKVEEPKKK